MILKKVLEDPKSIIIGKSEYDSELVTSKAISRSGSTEVKYDFAL